MPSPPRASAYEKRSWDPMWLAKALADPARPCFLVGSTPPREGTSPEEAAAICDKFVSRSRAHACDGFIVYDIQDESSRNPDARPFPFRRTVDPTEYAALFPPASGKSTVLYKAVAEPTEAAFDEWLESATALGHHTLNLVGPASAADGGRISLGAAAARVRARESSSLAFGCVTIAERHLSKGTEHLNLLRKTGWGARWFISQAVYDPKATIQLLQDYADECKRRGVKPAKIILTFAPVGRAKTMSFVRWLGIRVPEEVERRVLAKAEESKVAAVAESIAVCEETLTLILQHAGACGVPLGVSVESLSGFREEIDGCFELFRRLQALMLDSKGSPWGVRWYRVPLTSLIRSGSEEALAKIEGSIEAQRSADESGRRAAPTPGLGLDGEAPPAAPARHDVLLALALGLAAGAAIGFAVARKK